MVAPACGADNTISLSGTWDFIRGGPAVFATPGDLPTLNFADTIELPGTTETNRKGPASDQRATDGLSFPWAYVGACWYARDIDIPAAWEHRRIALLLERTKYTQVWLDGKSIGDNVICCTPQEYELGSAIAAGHHRLIVAVDNHRIPPMGADAHQFSGATQGNWNGIIGRIELHATPTAWIDQVEAYPDVADSSVKVKVMLQAAAMDGDGSVSLNVTAPDGKSVRQTRLPASWKQHRGMAEVDIPLGSDAKRWDEFHPYLYRVTVELKTGDETDQRQIEFGLRSFTAHGQQFSINGQTTFLRGKHDACVFPLTGCPPMDVDGWTTYFRTLQSYGLNHVRFHTWTPPDAAFEAADQLGMYLQPELPFWGPFDQKVKDRLKPEALAILRQLGNHPSFVMFSMGNEHWAGAEVLDALVGELKAIDSRHLYVRGTNAFSYRGRPGPNDDYYIGADVAGVVGRPVRHIRGANTGVGDALGHVQVGPPNTMTDYAAVLTGTDFPSVAHEMGQYTVFPDFKQLTKYTGVTRPDNLAQFQKTLDAAGMADQDEAFAAASGALAAICYREEIESALRTPGFGGFELLDLQDYPGQGSALVGMLDVFMDSKNLIPPPQWRQFCSPTVLLAKFPKYVWTTDETFSATVDLANYSDRPLNETKLTWQLLDPADHAVRNGMINAASVGSGTLASIGSISVPLDGLTAPARFNLKLALNGADIETSYPLWVYPPTVSITPPTEVIVARAFDDSTRAALAAGGKVLLICDAAQPLARTVGGGFANDFWGFNFFHNRPGTLGLLCDPAAQALRQFPTESHSDWQWFDIVQKSQPLVLDAILPRGVKPIVQVIDNSTRSHKIGLIFEVKVGSGRLLVCTSDLVDLAPSHPEARQLTASLLGYANSDAFNPAVTVTDEQLIDVFQTIIPMQNATATASSFDKGWQGYAPAQLLDANDDKGWLADAKQAGPVWCQIDFKSPADFSAVEVLWNPASLGCEYALETSADGKNWQTLRDHLGTDANGPRQRTDVAGRAVQHVRVLIDKTASHPRVGIDEIRFFPTPRK